MKSFGDWVNDLSGSIQDASTVGEAIKSESDRVDSIAEEWYDFDTEAFKEDVEQRIQRAKNIADAKGFGQTDDSLKTSGQAALDWATNKDDGFLDLSDLDDSTTDDYDWVDDGN